MLNYIDLPKNHDQMFPIAMHWLAHHVRASTITLEFGKHFDIFFGNLEGHGSPNPLKVKLKSPDLEETATKVVPKKYLLQILRTFYTENMTIGSDVNQHKNLLSF